jgi:Lytic transglycolase
MPGLKDCCLIAVAYSQIVRSIKALALWAGMAAGLCALDPTFATAKTPGTVHCYGGWCHRINTVDEMDAMVGRRGYVMASYYDDCKRDRFNPCGLTSSGAVFQPDRPDNAASPIFPDGTVLLIYNPETHLAAVVRVTSAGPYRGDRTLDVSRATAEHLGFHKRGVAPLEVAILKSPELQEARYSKLRVYASVPGFLGKFSTFDAAHDAALVKMRLDATTVMVALADPLADFDRLWPRALALAVHANLPASDVAATELAFEPYAPSIDVELVADTGPPNELNAFQTSEADIEPDLVVIARPSTDTASPASSKNLIIAFLEIARGKARVQRAPDTVDVSDDSDRADVSLIDRAKSFIRAAQFRARLGVGRNPAGSNILAAR